MAITTALQFSGGKDSLAVLHIWRNQLEDTLVTWVNTGAAYPAVIEYMKEVKVSVPHFLEIKTNQPEQIAQYGYPLDVVPIHFTIQGRKYRQTDKPYLVQSTFQCCAANIWLPMHNEMKARNITRIVRGQRRAETYKAPVSNGQMEDGIEYVFPIENWTEEQVFAYLKVNNIPIPSYYNEGESSSHDCWNCTGYLDEDNGRIRNLPVIERTEVVRRLRYINEAVKTQTGPLRKIIRDHDDDNDYLPYVRE